MKSTHILLIVLLCLLSSVRTTESVQSHQKMDASQVLRDINRDVSSNPVTVFGKSYCPFTRRVRTLMNELGANFRERDIDIDPEGYLMQLVLTELTGQPTVPYVFVNGQFIGGSDDTLALAASGELLRLLREANAL